MTLRKYLITLLVVIFISGSINYTPLVEAAEWQEISKITMQYNDGTPNIPYNNVTIENGYDYKIRYTDNADFHIGGQRFTGGSQNGGSWSEKPVTLSIGVQPFNFYSVTGSYGATAILYKKIQNNLPILSITSSGDKSLYNDSGTFTITGTVRDPDNDSIIISAIIGGSNKSTTITNTSVIKNWSLSWSGTEVPIGTYINPVVTVNDGKEYIDSNYNGTLEIKPQIYYYWSKYNTKPSEEWNLKNLNTGTAYLKLMNSVSSGEDYAKYMSYYYTYGQSAYPEAHVQGSNINLNGLTFDVHGPDSLQGYKIVNGKTYWITNYNWRYDVYELIVNPPLVKGTIIQSNIRAAQNTYPDDGIHIDNFWYTRTGSVPNNPPTGTINNINQKPISNQSTFSITGTAQDPDGDTLLIEATINGIKAQTSVINSTTSKPWTLTWNKLDIPDGNYSNIQVTISDGK